jgi:lipopolysaccharide export system protein LptA
LEARDGHIKDKNVDLKVPQFAFRSDTGDVHIPGGVNGKVSGGIANARGIEYNVNSGIMKAAHVRWEGKLAFDLQDGDQNASRVWSLEGDNSKQVGDIQMCDNGIATDQNIAVLADHLERNKKTEILTATGHVRYFSSKTNMLCEKAVIERKIKKATLTGNVQMLLKAKEKQDTVSIEEGIPPYRPVVPEEIAKNRPKADASGQTEEQKKLDEEIRSGKNARDYPTMCYADQVVYWYKKGERHAVITGNPQARQEFRENGWRQAWTNTAYYDGEKETLKLVSTDGKFDTRMLNSIGDDFVTDWVTFSTKEGDEDYEGGHMKGNFADYSEEVPPADKLKKPITLPGDKGNTGGGTGTTGGGGQKPPPPNRAKTSLSGAIQGKGKKKG